MKINVVIVDESVERGAKAGRQLATDLRKNFRGWEMHVHVRLPENTTTDDAYARYAG